MQVQCDGVMQSAGSGKTRWKWPTVDAIEDDEKYTRSLLTIVDLVAPTMYLVASLALFA